LRADGLAYVPADEMRVRTEHPVDVIAFGARDLPRLQTGAVMTFDPDRFAVTLLASMPNAVVYSDADGKIQYWNKGAEGIFGFTASEAIGQTLDFIVPANLRQRHWDGYAHTMRTGVTRYGAGDLPGGAGRPQGRIAHLDRIHDRAVHG
jgi:PAS domain-containing protein